MGALDERLWVADETTSESLHIGHHRVQKKRCLIARSLACSYLELVIKSVEASAPKIDTYEIGLSCFILEHPFLELLNCRIMLWLRGLS